MRTSGVARRPEGVLRATGDSSSFFFFFRSLIDVSRDHAPRDDSPCDDVTTPARSCFFIFQCLHVEEVLSD